MVAVEDVMSESLGAYIRDWFEPGLAHPFLGLQTVSVRDAAKPIPKLWVEDVEVQIEGDFRGDDLDAVGDVKKDGVSLQEGKMRFREALERLDLSETCVMHPKVNTFDQHQLGLEKRRVKQELKRYDSDFRQQAGRLPTHTEKEPMRPLYVYYRRLKVLISHGSKSGRRAANSDDEGAGSQPLGSVRESLTPNRDGASRGRGGGDPGRAGSAEDQITALEDRICSLQSDKSAVRAKLQAFQEKFVAENNRVIKYHKDILPVEREYRMYKNLKEEVAKAESQLRELQRG